jgi:acetyltransferase-like isoleucine patch superfamily enzyme
MIIRFCYKIITRIIKLYISFEKKQQNISFKKIIFNNGGKIGSDVKFGHNVKISGFKNIKIGNNVHIGKGCFIRSEGGLSIGDNVILSRNIVLYTYSHNYKGELLPFDRNNINKPVIIGDNVWIGMNVTIAPGTIIREGAIIGLGSRIYGEIPTRAIVGSRGNIIGYRDDNHYKNLKNLKKFCKENGKEYIEY